MTECSKSVNIRGSYDQKRKWLFIVGTLCIYTVSQKRPPFYFSNNSVKKLTDFDDFWGVSGATFLGVVGKEITVCFLLR